MQLSGVSGLLTPVSLALSGSGGTLTTQVVPALSLVTNQLVDPLQLQSTQSYSSQALSGADTLRQIQGRLTFFSGQVFSTITTPSGTTQQTYNLQQLATTYSNFARQIQGTASFNNGVLTSNLTTPSGSLQGTVNIAELAASLAKSTLAQVRGSFPFSNGRVALNIPTPFGAVTGTLGFGGGFLSPNLTTPFGTINQQIRFDTNARIPLTITGIPGAIDFNRGVLQVFSSSSPAGLSVPLTSLSGSVSFNSGRATLNVPLPVFGSVSTTFDVSQIVSDYAANYVKQVAGTLNFNNGVATGTLTGPFGSLPTNVDLSALVTTSFSYLQQLTGTVTLTNGVLSSSLVTASGQQIAGSLDLTSLANAIPAIGTT